jgi:Site-specific recombinase XerD
MNTVEPIRDEKKIRAMKAVLKSESIRNYMLFTLGINTGLRISDLLKLKIQDVMTDKGKIKDNIYIREKKTGKENNFVINKVAKEAITEYLNSLNNYETSWYLFKSKKGENSPISRVQAYEILNSAAHLVGIKDKIGCHTLRKTFGYHARMRGTPIEKLQKIFNHSAPSITMRYIGITQDELDDVYLELNL